MALRFRKRIKIAPGVHVNLSRRGVSTSVGPRGATINVKPGRETRATASVPGTGLYASAPASRWPGFALAVIIALILGWLLA